MLPEQCLQAIEIARDADGVARHVYRHPIPVGVARKLAQPVDDLAADCQVELMDEPGFLRKGNDLERALAGIRVEPAERLVMVDRSEEHTYELQSLMRSSYDVFCLQ